MRRGNWTRLVARRLFPWATPDEEDLRIYRREWITPASGPNTRHTLRRAF